MGRSRNRAVPHADAGHRGGRARAQSPRVGAGAGKSGPPNPAARAAARRRRRAVLAAGGLALFGLVAVAGLAWRAGILPARGVDRAALQPVNLPDLSALDPEARAQFEQASAELTALDADPAADRAALAEANGRLGSLLLAYDQPGAEAPLANAELLAPEEPRWPYYLGRVHRLAGDFERAAAAYERARERMPAYVPARIRVAQMYRELGRDDQAAALLESVLADDPRAALAHELLGQIAVDRGAQAEAARHFEAALALQPQASALRSPLALAYEKLGQPDKSKAQRAQIGTLRPTVDDPLEAALEELKVGASTWLMQADQALQSGRPAEAIGLYEKVVAADPGNARAFLNLGVARGQRGDPAGAVAAMRRAVAADPENAEFHQVLADQLADTGQAQAAEAAYRDALARDPRNAKAHLGLAERLRLSGRCAEALPNYSAALDLAPAETVGRVQRVFCLVSLGRYAEARADLEAARATFPDDPDILDALARVLAAAPDEAVRDGRRAVELAQALQRQRSGLDAQETMAMALAAAGAYDDAVRWQQGAIDLAKKEGQTAWLETLRANLDRYRSREPAISPWPPFVLAPEATGGDS